MMIKQFIKGFKSDKQDYTYIDPNNDFDVDVDNKQPNFETIETMETFYVNNDNSNITLENLMLLLMNNKIPGRLNQLDRYINCINMKTANFMTPLMMAAKMAKEGESLQILNFIIINTTPVNIDAQDATGKSALLHACECINSTSSVEACKILLKNGASPNILDDKGCNAMMMFALNYANPETINLTSFLVAHGVNLIRQSTNRKKTALMIACERFAVNNNDLLIKFLIDNKADLNQLDIDGNTALMQLCQSDLSKNKSIIKLLIRHKTNKNIVNHNGKTAFDLLFENKGKDRNELIDYLMMP